MFKTTDMSALQPTLNKTRLSHNGLMSRPELGRTLGLLVVLNVFWGAAWLPYKVVFEQLPVSVYAALRAGLVALVLTPFALADLRRHLRAGGQRPSLRNGPRLLLLALVGVVLNNGLVFNGAKLATATDASLLAITETLFTALLAWIFLKERFGPIKLAGLGLGVLGVYLLVAKGFYLPQVENGGQILGDLLLLGGFGFEALYTLLAAGSVRRFPPLVIVASTNLVSLLFWLPAALITLAQGGWTLPTLDWAGVAGLAYLVLICGALGYSLWFKALRRVEPGLISVTLFLQPLVGVAIGALLLGENLTPMTGLGGALVVASLGLIVSGATGAHGHVAEPELGNTGGASYAQIALDEPERRRLNRAISRALSLEED